ncbi:hypothetical protein L585_10435 [Pantoea ananatis BRT175]|nr:hypothetical protein L585_10435 [Pantoea ananatis BRT175]
MRCIFLLALSQGERMPRNEWKDDEWRLAWPAAA